METMGLVVREVVTAPRAHVLVRRRYGVYTVMSGVFSDHCNFSLCFVQVVSHAVLCACGVPPDGHELNAVVVSTNGVSVNGHVTAPLWSVMERASRFSLKRLRLPGIRPTGRIRRQSVIGCWDSLQCKPLLPTCVKVVVLCEFQTDDILECATVI